MLSRRTRKPWEPACGRRGLRLPPTTRRRPGLPTPRPHAPSRCSTRAADQHPPWARNGNRSSAICSTRCVCCDRQWGMFNEHVFYLAKGSIWRFLIRLDLVIRILTCTSTVVYYIYEVSSLDQRMNGNQKNITFIVSSKINKSRVVFQINHFHDYSILIIPFVC